MRVDQIKNIEWFEHLFDDDYNNRFYRVYVNGQETVLAKNKEKWSTGESHEWSAYFKAKNKPPILETVKFKFVHEHSLDWHGSIELGYNECPKELVGKCYDIALIA